MADPTERVRLGPTDVEVTRLGLGTAPLGYLYREVADEDAAAVLERAWDAGLRLFDTAPFYGHGLAERRAGAALRGRPRDAFTLSTKVGRLVRGDPPDSVFDFGEAAARVSLEESLARLGLDRVDVLHVHDPDRHADRALAGAFPALRALRSEGRVRAIGSGMNQWQLLARFVREASLDCVLLAGRFTLLDQSGLDVLLPLCLERGVGVLVGGPLNSGILADPRPGAPYNYAPAPPELVERARELGAVCERHGVPLAAAALQFPLRHPAVSAVLVGARSVEELDEDLRLFRWEMPDALWADLRAIGVRDPAAG
jgi:D-threo-aldose 1-dehydrogenase